MVQKTALAEHQQIAKAADAVRLASFRRLLSRTNVGAVSPRPTTGLMGGVRPLNTTFGLVEG